jgi:hypothetical protein
MRKRQFDPSWHIPILSMLLMHYVHSEMVLEEGAAVTSSPYSTRCA